jgi:hypothetical protein
MTNKRFRLSTFESFSGSFVMPIGHLIDDRSIINDAFRTSCASAAIPVAFW